MSESPGFTEKLLRAADTHRHVLLIAVTILYLVGFNGQWHAGTDSAMHLLVAENLAAGQGYIHPTGHERNISPGLSYLTAATFKIFGHRNLVPMHVIMLGLGLAALALTYTLARMTLDRPRAVVAVLLLAVAEGFYRYAFAILTDMPFLVGLLLFLVGWELVRRDGWRPAAGMAVLLLGVLMMAAFRSVVLAVLAAAGLAMLVHIVRGPHRGRYIALAAAAVLAVLAMRGADPRTASLGETIRDENKALQMLLERLPETLERAVTRNGPELLTENLAEGVMGVDFGPYLSLPLGIAVLAAGFSVFRIRLLWGLLVLVFLLQWLLLVLEERYLLVLLPLLAVGWWRLATGAERRLPPKWGRAAAVVLLVFWMVPNMIMLGRFAFEQHRSPFLASYEDGRYEQVKLMGQTLAAHVDEGDLVISEDAQPMMWYSGRQVVEADYLLVAGKRRITHRRLGEFDRLWMVTPLKKQLNWKLPRLGVQVGQTVAKVPYPGRPPLKLHEASLMAWRELRQIKVSPTESRAVSPPKPPAPGARGSSPGPHPAGPQPQ